MKEKYVRIPNKNAICGIYCVTNIITKKIYIGQSINIKKRWYEHKRGKGNIILGNSIKKYGLDNFKFEILELVNPYELTKPELIKIATKAKIKLFFSVKSNGHKDFMTETTPFLRSPI